MKDSFDNEKINQIKKLLDLFRFERYLNMVVTIMSFGILVTCAIVLILKKEGQGITAVLGLFGSTGSIGYTTGRLLQMWSDSIRILLDKQSADKNI